MQLIGGKSQAALQQVICLANQLHIAVLDTVVHHLHVVTGAFFAHPVAAGSSVFDLGGDGLEDILHVRPGVWVATGHDRRAKARAFFAAGDARADEENPFGGKSFGAPRRIGIQRVAAIDDDIACLKMRQNVIDHLVHCVAGLDHQHDAAGPLQQ